MAPNYLPGLQVGASSLGLCLLRARSAKGHEMGRQAGPPDGKPGSLGATS